MTYLGTVLFVSAIISMLSDQLVLAGVLLVLANLCVLAKEKSGSTPGFYLLTFGLSLGLYSGFEMLANILIATGSVLLGIKTYNSFLQDKTDIALDSVDASSGSFKSTSSFGDSASGSDSGGGSGGGE